MGTARRTLPDLPGALGSSRPEASREVSLLDAAALGGALRRAGTRAQQVPVDAVATNGAPDDVLAPPPARAAQLLDLLLHQSPVGPVLAPVLVGVWVEAAGASGHRVPHHLLPPLLDLATKHEHLRPAARHVADSRGAWLAAASPTWAWVVDPTTTADGAAVDAVDTDAWALLPTERRVELSTSLRATDPGRARELVESTWATDSASERARLLATLREGLGPDDEPLLERALDDRARQVRAEAAALLDGLPGSARAKRMGERLRPLVRQTGRLRKHLEVDLPADPDPAGVRDGLVRPPRVGSVRGWWLQRLVAGAPLELWTELGRTDPTGAWRMLDQQDVKVGIIEATLLRRDTAWAAALLDDVWHPGLLPLAPPERREDVALRLLSSATADQTLQVVDASPPPWSPRLSRAVLTRLQREKEPGMLVHQLTPALAAGLHPSTRPELDGWIGRLQGGARERVARLSQHLALVPEIPEAFR